MASIRQNADGSLGIFSDAEGVEVTRFGGPASASVAAPIWRGTYIAKIPLTASDTAGGVFAFQPPDTSKNWIFERVVLDVTTQSSAACTVSIGVAANATTLNSTLVSGQSVAAAGVFSAVNVQKYTAATQYVTGSVASGASAGLVGFAHLHFRLA